LKKRSLGVVAFVLLAACGGAAQSPASSPTAAPAVDTPALNSSGAPPPTTQSQQPGQADRALGGAAQSDEKRVDARAELEEAVHQLDASMNECAAACRALASMERATTHLCDIAQHAESDGDRTTCDDARKKLRAARERVRRACTTCPGGPTLDSSAPP
jgi:hypothetical protein